MKKIIIALGVAAMVCFTLAGCAHSAPTALPAPSQTATPSPTPSATPAGPPALADLEILPSGLGSLHIGESIAASDTVVFDPSFCASTPPGPITPETGRWVSSYTPPGFIPIAFGPTPILTSLAIFDPALKTARGIHVGSTLAELRAAYPELVAPAVQGVYSSVYWINWETGRLTFEVYENADAIKGMDSYVFNTVGSITISPVSNTERYAYFPFDAPGGCA